jgi:pimeloyl-ACP methyl ester carboxylesterase
MTRPETPRLEALQEALDRGDLDAVRRILLDLDAEEERLLRAEMGSTAFERARGAAARGKRRGKLGKVLVLPGIMGTELDAVDGSGDSDRIWINFVRLIAGRIGDLELNAQGRPARPHTHVRTAGLHRKTYTPLLMELDTRWHVRPFPFDWREDVDKSAARLDGEVKAFGGGDPVHLVAHSMGGLVSRRFIQLFPETWKAMNDANGTGKGGRLLMLGTPNRGSFSIPLTLSGAEKLVKLLAKADVHHSPKELLAIIGTFPGLYQMLPSALVELGDDHDELFDKASWGDFPVSKALLARGDEFLRDLDRVTDPERLLYIAGANLETPARIKIGDPGEFTYRTSFDGDGRVPHELGLLAGVTTYWVDGGVHGDLAKHTRVLDAVTELLQTGKTAVLPTAKPPKPERRARAEWVPAEAVAPLPAEVDAILARPKAERRAGAPPELTAEEQIRLENLALAEYLGTGEEVAPVPRGLHEEALADAERLAVDEAPAGTRPKIEVEVLWGDVTAVEADVYVVGHYEGVLPDRAELALDRALSGISGRGAYGARNLVITQHTRRGTLRADIGDVSFFPWKGAAGRDRVVAVAGMGRHGTFDTEGLRRLVHSVVIAVSALPGVETACSVLIGSGEGSLRIADSVRGYIEGIADAADEIAAGGEKVFAAPVDKLIIAELDRGRAEEILETFETELGTGAGRARAPSVELDLYPRLKRGKRGRVSIEEGIALLADALVDAAHEGKPPQAEALANLLAVSGANETIRKLTLDGLRTEAVTPRTSARPRFRVGRRTTDPAPADVPARISFWYDGETIRAAAIDHAATVAERVVRVGEDVVADLTKKMTDPDRDEVGKLCELLYQLLIPTEFRDFLHSGPLVFEVDRKMAQVQWEMLSTDDGGGSVPLAVQRPLARQLRTTYSPDPGRTRRPDEKFRVLIIGDPGDPARGEDLPGARSEAVRVKELLEAPHNKDKVEVDARIGAPNVPREGPLQDVTPADRLEVLSLLLGGDYDLVHYAGHGDFDPDEPDRVGWVFAGGLLTPGEIGRIERVPAVIVSNACLSARTSEVLESGRGVEDARSEAGLLPSLADEFFKLGVRNYVGTAWEVNDIGAGLFAETFYKSLLAGKPVGEAVRAARDEVWRTKRFGALWAAYQHYGDPGGESGLRAGA